MRSSRLRTRRPPVSSEQPAAVGRQSPLGFDTAARVVGRVADTYGPFQNLECQNLKRTLVSMDRIWDRQGPASGALSAPGERPGQLGVLDNSFYWQGTQLTIPIYILSHSNCIEGSDYYSICCPNECDELLGAIEAEVRKPHASVEQIVQVVERPRTDHGPDEVDDLPKGVAAKLWGRLSSALRGELEEVAAHHKGRVPLHGRLFAKRLHSAFPHECPFPQKSSEMEALTVTEWVNQGTEFGLSAEEIERLLEKDETEQADQATHGNSTKVGNGTQIPGDLLMSSSPKNRSPSLTLTEEEELYVGHHHEGPRRLHGLGGRSSTSSSMGIHTSFGGLMAGLAKAGLIGALLFGLKKQTTTHECLLRAAFPAGVSSKQPLLYGMG